MTDDLPEWFQWLWLALVVGLLSLSFIFDLF